MDVSIDNSYAVGELDAIVIGGLIGAVATESGESTTTLTNSYAGCTFESNGEPRDVSPEQSPLGGLVGIVIDDLEGEPGRSLIETTPESTPTPTPEPSPELLSIETVYWDTDKTGGVGAIGLEDGPVKKEDVDGLPTAEMQGTEASDNMGLDFTDIWLEVVSGQSLNSPAPQNDGYPILSGLDSETQLDQGQGIGLVDVGTGVEVEAEDVTIDNVTFGGDE